MSYSYSNTAIPLEIIAFIVISLLNKSIFTSFFLFLATLELAILNECYPLFMHLDKILREIKLSYICDLFKYNTNY